ncbi:MAG TPA: sigma-70 family RNA polymerase sigma factor [Gemmatimonadaceae bacterium]
MTPTGDVPADLQSAVAQSRRQFVAAASSLRPRLHRFCARMCGSALDGEDVVQETLAEAFYNIAGLKDPTKFESWMFRIAYHKCIDFLRRERRRNDDVPFGDDHDRPDVNDAELPSDAPIDEALGRLVSELPPMERASVVLKDVLDYSLADVAEIAESTVGGVKAALHRGRAKLRAITSPQPLTGFDPGQRRLFDAYAECFNRRDWDGLKHLVRADARLEIVGSSEGRMSGLGSTYSSNYTALPYEWKLTAALVDGVPALIHWRRGTSGWEAHTTVRLWFEGGQVVRIRDYIHVDYLLRDAMAAGD